MSAATLDLRVLLLSPMPNVDPPNGEDTYTETLLANPPEGVTYVRYTEALRSGELRIIGTRRTARSVTGLRCAVARKSQRALASARLAFREPVLTADVRGRFDLVHVHALNVGFVGKAPPVVLSSASPTHMFYEDSERWPLWRARIARRVTRSLARLARSRLMSDHPLPNGEFVIFSEYVAMYYADLGVDPRRLHLIPNFLPAAHQSRRSPTDSPKRVGFVADNFEAKGGSSAVMAFHQLRSKMPDAELICVGHIAPERFIDEPAIEWLGEIDRHKLLDEVLPSLDALVYPTPIDGVPFTVIEALSAGCPIVTVRYRAMPELVPHLVAGVVCPDETAESLAAAMARVLEPHENKRLGNNARRWFEAHYSDEAVLPRLANLYTSTAAGGR